MGFLSKHFFLMNKTARTLYHDYAKEMPIYDYHCHLPPQDVAENRQFNNLTHIWLAGDHYKWRAMRTNGVAERFITGDANDWEKFQAWAQTCTLYDSKSLISLDPFRIETLFWDQGQTPLACNGQRDLRSVYGLAANRGIPGATTYGTYEG